MFGPERIGRCLDAGVEEHYNYFRDYDAQLGRYLESDPIGLRAGLNTYGYGAGSPLVYVDPTGEAISAAGIIVIGLGGYGAYKLWDKHSTLKKCTVQCSVECDFRVACGDPERTSAYEDNKQRCRNTCVPLCVAEFMGGPKKGPTGPQPPKKTPDFFPNDPLPPYTWTR